MRGKDPVSLGLIWLAGRELAQLTSMKKGINKNFLRYLEAIDHMLLGITFMMIFLILHC